ncbi:MAG TPA: DegV family protein [Dehalococcoidales bacterium]|nr:DegV family protein [Dehalococcoidales bacterium]
MTIKIVTDSVADLPPQIVKDLDITVIPVNVCFGEEVYRDGIDISAEQFYAKLAGSKVMPVTSVPGLGVFAETYGKLAEETDEILFISLSSKLSSVYKVAQQSVELMKKKCRVEVVDSQWVIMAQGFIVMTAARAAQAGASLDEVLNIVHRNINRVQLCSVFDTLEYLKRGGRIGRAAALLGTMLHVHPIIGLKDGEVVPMGRKRSRAQAIDYLYDLAMSYSHIEEMSVAYVNAVEDAEMLIDRLSVKFPRERVIRSRTSPVIGTHTGPNLLVLALLGDR